MKLDRLLGIVTTICAPRSITARLTPAAKFAVLYFFLTDLSSRSITLLLGRMMATALISPVSSSMAYSVFSMRDTGSTSLQMPQPCEQTAWIISSVMRMSVPRWLMIS